MDFLMDPAWMRVADHWAEWMLAMSWQVALLAGLVWIVTRLFRKTSAAFRYTLWFLVLLKLVLPPSLSAPWSLGNVAHYAPDITISVRDNGSASNIPPAPSKGGEENIPPAPFKGGEEGQAQGPRADLDAGTPAVAVSAPDVPAQTQHRDDDLSPLAANIPAAAAAATERDWRVVLMLTWASVAVALFLRVLVQSFRYHRRIVRDCSPLDPALMQRVRAQAARLRVWHAFDVCTTPHLNVPMVCYLPRPTILLPAFLVHQLTVAQFDHLMGHELAHIKRCDVELGWLATLLLCLYWFHPAVWLAHLNLRREREMACDDEVLYASRPESKEYASTLLRVAESFDGSIPAGNGFLGLFEVGEHLLQRIRSISDPMRPRRVGLRAMVAVVLLAFLLVPMGIWAPYTTAQESAIEEEIQAHYAKADPEVIEFVRMTAERFGPEGLWLDAGAFASLTPDERQAKVEEIREAIEGPNALEEYRAIAEAGALADPSFIPGLTGIAWYMREGGQDNRSKWMAVAALGRIADRKAVPTLIPLVDHYNKNVRMWARASLVRLTGQNFGADKQAWANWANVAGPETAIAPATLEWASRQSEEKMAAKQVAQTLQRTPAAPTTTPTPPEAVANVPKTVDDVPGNVVFKANYIHKSRGSQLPDRSTVSIKISSDSPVVGAAVCEFPAMQATFIATYEEPRFTSYVRHGSPTTTVMDLGEESVAVHYVGGDKDGQTETYTVPRGATFDPNTRPDPYVASFLLQDIYRNAEQGEFTVFDWDNSGKGMASYTIRVENVGEETVVVPAGVFKADHVIQTQTSFGDTWYKKRPGHITEYWVARSGAIIRVLRHREPYEVLLASVDVGAEELDRVDGEAAKAAQEAQAAAQAATPQGQLEAAANEEIAAHYATADEQVKEYIRWTARTFGPGHLWQPARAFASLNPEEYRQKVEQMVSVLDGEYGRHLCETLADAGAFKHPLLLPGLTKHASYHREDSDYDCRPKWIAVSSLGRQDDISAVPALIPLVDHGNENTRMWARASLARLTGQWLGDDKQAWAKWWNESGHEPKIDLSELKPWTPPAGAGAAESAPAATESAPEIVAVTPAIGATVDPATTEIRVTFDQDMNTGGFSWTGGGEVYPEITARPFWADARTCVLPVKLVPAKFYRVGINSKSHKNFRGANGVPARNRAVYFATEGLPEDELSKLMPPRVVSLDPANGATDVSPATTELKVTFDKPMGGGFSWVQLDDHYPDGTGAPAWSENNTVCTRPVSLEPNTQYRLSLNSGRHINFQSAAGLPLEPVVWEFTTGNQS